MHIDRMKEGLYNFNPVCPLSILKFNWRCGGLWPPLQFYSVLGMYLSEISGIFLCAIFSGSHTYSHIKVM